MLMEDTGTRDRDNPTRSDQNRRAFQSRKPFHDVTILFPEQIENSNISRCLLTKSLTAVILGIATSLNLAGLKFSFFRPATSLSYRISCLCSPISLDHLYHHPLACLFAFCEWSVSLVHCHSFRLHLRPLFLSLYLILALPQRMVSTPVRMERIRIENSLAGGEDLIPRRKWMTGNGICVLVSSRNPGQCQHSY